MLRYDLTLCGLIFVCILLATGATEVSTPAGIHILLSTIWNVQWSAWLQAISACVTTYATTSLLVLTRRQLSVAEISAEAARLAAGAAVNSETATLITQRPEFTNTTADLLAKVQFPRVKISVVNYGRTPAYVFFQAIDITDSDENPTTSMLHAHDLQPPAVIGPQESYELPISMPARLFTVPECEEILAGKRRLRLYGLLCYQDFMGQRKILRFCRRFLLLPAPDRRPVWLPDDEWLTTFSDPFWKDGQ